MNSVAAAGSTKWLNVAVGGNGGMVQEQKQKKIRCMSFFQMPLHYPRYSRADYEVMPEWKLDCLLTEYGLPVKGDLAHKRAFAIGAFLWH